MRARMLLAAAAVVTACSGADGAGGEGSQGGSVATRESRRDPDPVLATGTLFELRAADTITSRRNHVGDTVRARVPVPVPNVEGRVVIPAGAVLMGTIREIAPAERPGQQGRLWIAFNRVQIRGRTYPVGLQVMSMATVVQDRGFTAGDAAKVGAGAVAGGVAGRVIGGDRRGTIVGAAAGTAVGAVLMDRSRDVDIVLPRGGAVRVRLTSPFPLTERTRAAT